MDAFQHIETGFYFVLLGAFIGSFKASIEIDKGKPLCEQLTDVLLGIYVGVSVTYHYGSPEAIWLGGLLSVVGGASGAMVVNVLMSLIPVVVKHVVSQWLAKLK